jgi:hypothetical protein
MDALIRQGGDLSLDAAVALVRDDLDRTIEGVPAQEP